jgi:hypothetical protein
MNVEPTAAPAEESEPLPSWWFSGWRLDLWRFAGAASVVAALWILGYYGQYALKFLGPPQRCWEYKEVEGKLYKVNPCTGQFQLIGDAPPPGTGK